MSKKGKEFLQEVWAEALEKWELADFRAPASDSRGHSHIVTYRCSPDEVSLQQMIVNSHKFPFRDVSELRRWGMHWAVRVLMDMEPECFEKANVLAVSDQNVVDEKREQEQDIQRINNLVEAVNMALAAGQKTKARKMVRGARDTYSKAFKEDTERRDWLLKQLEEKFSDLSKPARIIPLREFLEAEKAEEKA